MSDATLDKLAQASSGSLTTRLYKRGFRQPVMVGLKPVNKTIIRFAGRAYTTRFIPAREDIDTYATLTTTPNGDNLQWVGVDQVGPGEVVVIDRYHDGRFASMGNMLVTRMMKRGARGVVTDGAFRDGTELSAMDFPICSAGITASTRLSFHHVADLQVAIGCAGVAVYAGDVIHGDGDSITVVPAHLAAELAHAGLIRKYFDACSAANYDALMSCCTADAIHYFPPGQPDIPWRTTDVIARKWIWCVENLGSQWTIEKILVSHDSNEAVIEWTHWKLKLGTAQRGDINESAKYVLLPTV